MIALYPIDGSLLYPQYSSFAPEMFTKVNDEFVANAGTESIPSLVAKNVVLDELLSTSKTVSAV